jgi:hypothetical protein
MLWLILVAVVAQSGCSHEAAYSPDTLQQWHAAKAELGPIFADSPAWQAHMAFVEESLMSAGVVEVQKCPAPYTRWWAPDNPLPQERQLRINGQSLPVASYWAYSGSTPAAGIIAPLLLYKKGMPKEALRDHIVVFEVGHIPPQMLPMFDIGHEYATADLTIDAQSIVNEQWYQGNFVTRFGKWDELLKDSGAAGAIVIFAMSPERLSGLYTFPLLNLGIVGVPGIYVDSETGKLVLAAAANGDAAALTLVAHEESAEPYFYTAVLPGKNYDSDGDEQVLLVTHSDGPNLSQENGTLGIVALIRHFARLPQSQRGRSLRVLLDPQHYTPGRHTIDWYQAHPEVMEKVVASIGVEQLGQREYGEDVHGYRLTGRPEPMQLFTRDDPHLIAAAIHAIDESGVPRTELRVPERKDQGRWIGLGDVAIKHDLAGFATLSGMSGYWSTVPGIESFDKELAYRQVNMLVMLTEHLME